MKALKQELTTLHVLLEDTNTDTKRTVQVLRDEKEKIEVELERYCVCNVFKGRYYVQFHEYFQVFILYFLII